MNTTAHETPTPGSIWTHRSGRKYRVLLVANDVPDPKPPYLPIVVYAGVQNGKFWAGLLSDWHRRMTFSAAPTSTADKLEAVTFQHRVQPWMLACFGEEISRDVSERNHRFLEEALELVQSTGCTASEAHQLVDYVFNRPTGETHQEIGGVMVTLAALCLALGEDMHAAAETELARIWSKVEKIRAKQAAKPKHSPLPEHVSASPAATSAETQGGDEVREAAEDLCIAVERDIPSWQSFSVRTHLNRLREALSSPSTSAATRGEPVAWVQPGYLSMLQKCGSCSMRAEPIEAMDYIVPIYGAPPAPAVESAQVKVKPAVAPAGWKLVPIKLTDEMARAGAKGRQNNARASFEDGWKFALETVPSPPAPAVESARVKAREALFAELLAFVQEDAKSNPVFAKGHGKIRIAEARALVARASLDLATDATG